MNILDRLLKGGSETFTGAMVSLALVGATAIAYKTGEPNPTPVQIEAVLPKGLDEAGRREVVEMVTTACTNLNGFQKQYLPKNLVTGKPSVRYVILEGYKQKIECGIDLENLTPDNLGKFAEKYGSLCSAIKSDLDNYKPSLVPPYLKGFYTSIYEKLCTAGIESKLKELIAEPGGDAEGDKKRQADLQAVEELRKKLATEGPITFFDRTKNLKQFCVSLLDTVLNEKDNLEQIIVYLISKDVELESNRGDYPELYKLLQELKTKADTKGKSLKDFLKIDTGKIGLVHNRFYSACSLEATQNAIRGRQDIFLPIIKEIIKLLQSDTSPEGEKMLNTFKQIFNKIKGF